MHEAGLRPLLRTRCFNLPINPIMKPSIIAILLIVIGAAMLAYEGFTYTTREKAIDLGPIQVTAEKQHYVYLPPVLGGVLLIGGVLMLLRSKGN